GVTPTPSSASSSSQSQLSEKYGSYCLMGLPLLFTTVRPEPTQRSVSSSGSACDLVSATAPAPSKKAYATSQSSSPCAVRFSVFTKAGLPSSSQRSRSYVSLTVGSVRVSPSKLPVLPRTAVLTTRPIRSNAAWVRLPLGSVICHGASTR